MYLIGERCCDQSKWCTCGINRRWACGGGDKQRMETVQVFISTGRFRSFDEMRTYIDQNYNEDGEGIPSEFM